MDTSTLRYGSDALWLNLQIEAWWNAEQDTAGDLDPYPCSDNFRLCCNEDPKEVEEYNVLAEDGCCGSVDVKFGPSPSGKTYTYGFNYGH